MNSEPVFLNFIPMTFGLVVTVNRGSIFVHLVKYNQSNTPCILRVKMFFSTENTRSTAAFEGSALCSVIFIRNKEIF